MTPLPTDMREYAVAKTGALLNDVAAAVVTASRDADEPSVHKMRVSIRRFQQSIRLFEQYLKRGGVKRVKAQLRAIMQLAGELRNRDIAMGLVKDAGGPITELTQQRLEQDRKLAYALKQQARTDLAESWRQELGLDPR